VAAVLLGTGAGGISMVLFHLTWWDTLAVGLLTAAYSVYSVDKAALYGFGRTVPYAVLEVTTSGLAIVATVLVVLLAWPGYLFPLVVGYGLFVLGAQRILHAEVRSVLATETAREATGTASAGDRGFDRAAVIGYAELASAGTLSGAGFLQATQLLAYGFGTAAQAAYFAASVALVAPLYFLPRALGLALFPAMAGAHGAGDVAAVRQHADLFTRTLVVVIAPVLVAAEFLAPVMLTVFGGGALAGGATVLRVMLVATYLGVIQVPAVNALASGAGRRSWLPAIWAVTGCLVGLGAVAVLGGPLGSTGVALGYLIGVTIVAGGPLIVVWRDGRMPWAGPLTRSLSLVGASAVGAPALAATVGVSTGYALAGAAGAMALAVAVVGRDLLRVPAIAAVTGLSAQPRRAATSR
jgi:O-antigen/teichoic acid export membrane protein